MDSEKYDYHYKWLCIFGSVDALLVMIIVNIGPERWEELSKVGRYIFTIIFSVLIFGVWPHLRYVVNTIKEVRRNRNN